MKVQLVFAMSAMGLLLGCGGYNESTPEGFYMAYVQAWAEKDVGKIVDMHFTTDAKPNGIDYSRNRTESEVRAWMEDDGSKTPQSICKKAIKEIKSFYYSDNVRDNVKVLSGRNASDDANIDPLLHIEKVDGKWKVISATGSKTSRQDWIRH